MLNLVSLPFYSNDPTKVLNLLLINNYLFPLKLLIDFQGLDPLLRV